MKYPLIPGQTVEYMVLHALESKMIDVWTIQKHLNLRGVDYMLRPGQISSALQRLKSAGLAINEDKGRRRKWRLASNT